LFHEPRNQALNLVERQAIGEGAVRLFQARE
jgi:hypothetical protein